MVVCCANHAKPINVLCEEVEIFYVNYSGMYPNLWALQRWVQKYENSPTVMLTSKSRKEPRFHKRDPVNRNLSVQLIY